MTAIPALKPAESVTDEDDAADVVAAAAAAGAVTSAGVLLPAFAPHAPQLR